MERVKGRLLMMMKSGPPPSPYKEPSTRAEGAVCNLAEEDDLMVM